MGSLRTIRSESKESEARRQFRELVENLEEWGIINSEQGDWWLNWKPSSLTVQNDRSSN
jgi:hypothetical protein